MTGKRVHGLQIFVDPNIHILLNTSLESFLENSLNLSYKNF